MFFDYPCDHEDCNVLPCFGYPGVKKTTCVKHKKAGMMIHPTRKCEVCKEQAYYGLRYIPTHCAAHKSDNHIYLVYVHCKRCNICDIADEQQLCVDCSPTLKKCKRSLQQKHVEQALLAASLEGHIPTPTAIDSAVCKNAGCRLRPDITFDATTHVVVIEVDEYQHRYYENESVRMLKLAEAFQKPVIFIRYNPDTFKGKWKTLTERARLDELIRCLKDCLTTTTEYNRSAMYLFYDGTKEGIKPTLQSVN